MITVPLAEDFVFPGNNNSLNRGGTPPSSSLYSSSPTTQNPLYSTNSSILGNFPYQQQNMGGYGNAMNSITSGLAQMSKSTVDSPGWIHRLKLDILRAAAACDMFEEAGGGF